MMNDDMVLVRAYVASGSEQAFAALVSRHVDLVYSVALRQVRDCHLAEEITQAVFILLARKANSLGAKTILAGWLCRTARFVSADTMKAKRRRQIREQEAHMHSTLNEPDSDPWRQIEPMLDEALNCLGGKDHDAVVLRYFGGKDLREVGAALGMKEDAARMRVNRGLEKLRKFFTRRGVVLSVPVIAASVAARSVQAAPTGLASVATKAALSGTVVASAASIAATKAIAMTTLQKIIFGASMTVLLGAGIYETRQAARFRDEVQALQKQQAPLAAQLQQLQHERDDAANQLAAMTQQKADNAELLKLRSEVTQLRQDSQELAKLKAASATNNSKSLSDQVDTLLERVQLLKQRFAGRPRERIPELEFLTEDDWLRTAATVKQLVTDEDYRPALSDLRVKAEYHFLEDMSRAVQKFIKENNSQFPTDLVQLKSYFKQQPDDALLQRYQVVPANMYPAAGAMSDPGDWLIVLKENLREPNYEGMSAVDRTGASRFVNTEQMNILAPAMRALSDDTPPDATGKKSVSIRQLEPYLKTPAEKAAYQALMQNN